MTPEQAPQSPFEFPQEAVVVDLSPGRKAEIYRRALHPRAFPSLDIHRRTEMTSDVPKESAGTAPEDSALAALTPEEKEELYQRARRRAGAKLSVYIHTVVFIIVMVFLLFINLSFSPEYMWSRGRFLAGAWGSFSIGSAPRA